MAFSKKPVLIILGALFLGRGWITSDPGRQGKAELSGSGFVHYHLYPDTGQCYCGVEYDFKKYGKMVAAASESIHHFFRDSLCTRQKYAYLRSNRTGAKVRVLIVDKGGQPTGNFREKNQHIMDLSKEAFDELDVDGEGARTGRLYVTWDVSPWISQ